MKTNCLLCQSANVQYWTSAKDIEYYSEGTYKFYKCLDCSVLFIDPIPKNKLHEIYPPQYYSFTDQPNNILLCVKSWLDRKTFKKVLRLIPDQELKVLDIGGGVGWLLNEVRRVDDRIKLTAVIDINAKAKVIAQKNGHLFYENRIEEFKTPITFDLILAINLIEHVENPVIILKKMNDFLNKNGRIIIKTPNFESLDAVLFRNKNWGGYHCPRHWILFNEHSFRAIASQNGLIVESLTYTQGAPFWSMSMINLLINKNLIRRTEHPLDRHFLMGPLMGVFAVFDLIRSFFMPTSQMEIILRKANIS